MSGRLPLELPTAAIVEPMVQPRMTICETAAVDPWLGKY
jgi:hypothetical protein